MKMGYKYTKKYTKFNIYSNAKELNLILNDEKLSMLKGKGNIFSLKVKGDLENYTYMYEIIFEDEKYISIDPYAIACNANSQKGVIINPKKANIRNFKRMKNILPLDSIIYELSIRDFTLDAKNKGKFLGVIEKKQLNYLKKLGITHVQILPFYDFSSNSVDELDQFKKYNWGYDPENYNIPEGSYSTNPNNPYTRIIELKKMIKKLHDNGIGVIMDVVYNHVFDAQTHSLYKTVRKDAFRYNDDGTYSNGTGCGNDIASENSYISKYIVDSVIYWAKEYHLDGFRFDLMGILDIETMRKIRQELDKIDKNIIILGEGWDLNTKLDSSLKANQNNANKLENIAFFNDDMRDSLRGSTFDKLGKGFVNGGKLEERLLNSIKGGKFLKTYISPNQLIQYIEAHDNNTVFDHFEIVNKNISERRRLKLQSIATSIVLTSQGIPFLHAGQEFFRTKQGVENSYKSSDEINKFDFKRAKKYSKYVKYISELIKYRKEEKLFKLDSFDTIEEKFDLLYKQDNVLAYSLDKKIYILVNTGNKNINIKLPSGKYKLEFSDFKRLDEIIEIKDNKYELSKDNFVILKYI